LTYPDKPLPAEDEPSPVEDEPLINIDVTNRSPSTSKRPRCSSSDTTICLPEEPDATSELELEDTRCTKRRRLYEKQTESHISYQTPKTKPTILPTPSSPSPSSGASNESQGGGARSRVPSPDNLCEEDDGAYAQGVVGKYRVDTRSRSTMPTRKLRNITSAQLSQLSRPESYSASRSCSPQTASPRIKARRTTNTVGPNANMAYQITDFTRCHVPKGASILTAVVRSESSSSLNPIVLDHEVLGVGSEIIRTTQLSPDSWMLLGYRRDDGGSDACNCESLTLLNADRTSSSFSDTASDDSNHPDDGDEDEESLGEYRPGAGRGHRLGKGDKRTHVPWPPSDEERLLSYRGKMGMEWEDIYKKFPKRSEGAIQLRYYILRKRRERAE